MALNPDLDNQREAIPNICTRLVEEYEEKLCLGRKALHYLAACLLGESYEEACSPAFPATPAFVSNNTGVITGLIPVGFYALHLWTGSEPITCCVVGTPSDTTFYSLAKKGFRKSEQSRITVERSSLRDAEFDLNVDSISVRLRYHQNPLIGQWAGLDDVNLVHKTLKELPRESQQRFAEVETINKVARSIDGTLMPSKFWITHWWAAIHGLISHAFGGLTEPEILALTFEAMERKPNGGEDTTQFVSAICGVRIDSLSLSQRATDLGLPKVRLTDNKCALIRRGQSRMLDLLFGDHLSVCDLKAQWPFFLSSWERYIRIDLSFWGASAIKGGRFFKAVEHAISRLSERLVKHCRNVSFHVWPVPFVSSSWSDPDKIEDKISGILYETSFFIGCGMLVSGVQSVFPDDDTVSKWFMKGLESAGWDDFTSAYTHAEIIEKVDAFGLVPDNKKWGPVPEEQQRNDSSGEESDSEQIDPFSTSRTKPTKPTSNANISKLKALDLDDSAISSCQPLRPALDVLHRIQHDMALDTTDYIIGYLDRHTGLQEMPFEWWVSKDATSEEFIPQSRIRYFKRKSDNVLVWDRDGRKDLIFGSGRVDKP